MPVIHPTPHPLAGKTVRLKAEFHHPDVKGGSEYRVEDWWDRIGGKSWMDCEGNAACLVYAIRAGVGCLSIDNNVLYGKVGAFGHLVHESEIEAPVGATH